VKLNLKWFFEGETKRFLMKSHNYFEIDETSGCSKIVKIYFKLQLPEAVSKAFKSLLFE
jgi:hypothetical protein